MFSFGWILFTLEHRPKADVDVELLLQHVNERRENLLQDFAATANRANRQLPAHFGDDIAHQANPCHLQAAWQLVNPLLHGLAERSLHAMRDRICRILLLADALPVVTGSSAVLLVGNLYFSFLFFFFLFDLVFFLFLKTPKPPKTP